MTDPESDLFETIIRESPRVLPLVSDQGNREQLAEWLRSHETLMHASFEGNPLAVDFDVCILDEGAFEQYRDQLRQIKDEAEPVIVPYLLLLPEFDAGDVESDSLVDSVTASTVDEITTIPIKQRELEWRVQSLLRLRNQSIEAQTEGRRYQALFESVNDAILVTDTDRTIVDCNGSFTDLFGYSLAEIAGEPTHTIYEEDTEFEAMGDAIDEHIGDTSFRKVVSYETKTGAVFPGETGVFYLRDRNGTIQGYIRLIRDVSERLQREREFERYEAAIDGSTDLLMAADRDRLVMFTNKRFRELVGGDDQEVRGSHLRDILDEDVFETVDPRFERALDGETGQFDYEHPTDGEGARVFDVHYYPLREGSGDEITGVVAALRDVTEREQRKRKLRQFKQAVDAAGHAIYMTDADRQITYANQAFEDVTGYAPTDVIG
ncbi:MAG: PAS domain S-box protein, partial [archaeon]